MDALRLSRLVALVEEGEPLAEQDLDFLAQEVSRQPGNLDLLVCFGHALINSEKPSAALPVFDRALGMKPDEVIILNGRARAYAALDRYREAEEDLRRCIRIYPRHADSLRVLSLLRLRAGAPGEAIRLAELVFETDPHDEEAQQILEEARAHVAGGGIEVPPPGGQAGRDEFAKALAEALEARGLKSRVDAQSGVLVVRFAPGRDGRLSLNSLYDGYAAGDRPLTEAVTGLADGLLLMKDPNRIPELESVRERLFPVVRTTEFLAQSGPTLSSAAPGGLLCLYAVDFPDFVSYLPPEAAEKWGLSVEELAAQAMRNLERRPLTPSAYRMVDGGLEETDPSGSFDFLAFDSGDGYDAARLLSPVHRRLLAERLEGSLVATIPNRAFALVARERDETAVRFMEALAKSEARGAQRVTEQLYRLSGDTNLEPFAPKPAARA